MTDIDYILELFDWNKSEQEQKKGLELASSVKCLNAFLQPGFPYGKRVWKNCAKVVASKNDDILSYFIFDLFDWIEDLNWPGALIILDRLKTFSGKMLLTGFMEKYNWAVSLNAEEGLMLLDNLSELLDNKSLKEKLPTEIIEALEKHYHNPGYWYTDI